MSQCEDFELKDLVTEALEKNGVLAQIRAQLRANIFMTLDDENGQKHQNPKLKSVFDSQFGFLAFILIQELLDFCNLVQTSSIFKSESGQGCNYSYEGRDVLLKKHFKFANLSENHCDIPVLVHLIKFLFDISKTSPQNSAENVNNSEEKSFESECGVNIDPQNNTFVINSGRSDNYDLSFVSDAESSGSSAEKKLSLNLTNSTESSSESVATELNESKQKSVEYGKFENSQSERSTKPDGDSQDSSRISEALFNNESSSQENTASSEQIKTDVSVQSTEAKSESNKSSNSSYSKYLKEKQNSAKQAATNDSQQNKQLNENQDGEPVDIVMRHVIQNSINKGLVRELEGEESLSEELQAFEKKKNDNSEMTDGSSVISEDTVSPVRRNILDETLQETPKTKRKAIDNINSLKLQCLRITDNDEIILCDGNDALVKQKNCKNKKTVVNDEKSRNDNNELLIVSSTNPLPLYTNSTNKTSVIVNADAKRDLGNVKNS